MTVAEFETLAEQEAAVALHQAADLVARGCPPRPALRILF
jgi:hypothetical protein